VGRGSLWENIPQHPSACVSWYCLEHCPYPLLGHFKSHFFQFSANQHHLVLFNWSLLLKVN
jgi:hypothetical protein